MKSASTSAEFRLDAGSGDAVLVSPQWLEAHLGDAGVRVVEVDVSVKAYNDWHIDGAVLWNVYSDLKDADYRPVGRPALEQLVMRSGIGPKSTVVFYGYAPALGFWLMKLYAHADVRILDCSRDTWRSAGRPWSNTASEATPGELRLGAEDPGIRAIQPAVLDAIGHPGTTLVDVRSAAEYRGDCFWPSGGMEPGGRVGHVPSAVHQPIDDLYNDDGSFRCADDLRHLFSSVDIEGGNELITYCTVGGRASTAWFALTYLLGRDRVRVYDGSWAEWGRLGDAPTESS